MTSADDRIIRFHDELAAWLDRELGSQPEKLLWGHHDVARAVFNYMWYSGLRMRDAYLEHCRKGDDGYLNRITLRIPEATPGHRALVEADLAGHPWRKALEEFHGRMLVYADNPRHIRHLLPALRIFREREEPVVLLTRTEDLPDEIAGPNLRPLYFSPIISRAVTSSGLCGVNGELASFAHTLLCYVSWLKPKAMICCDGCQTQYQLAAIYCRGRGIPAICCQLGWPGFIHAGFRRLPYTHFLTWGEAFSRILQPCSPATDFHAVGRFGPIDREGPHDAITFFMQAPIFVSSDESYRRFLRLIEGTARRYPRRRIIVRPHPEYSDDRRMDAAIAACGNIAADTNPEVEATYRATAIAVSQYSSCLVESAAFGCTPLMFNPTSGFDYPLLPDWLKSRSEEEFFSCLDHIIRRRPDAGPAAEAISHSGEECGARFAAFIDSLT